MRMVILLLVVLTNINPSRANSLGLECDWMIGQWKCVEENRGSVMYYNIVNLDSLSYRINFHPSKIPEINSYIGFNIYMDGRWDENINGRSLCMESKLTIDYMENSQDNSSVDESHSYEQSVDGMLISQAYLNQGAVVFTNCKKLQISKVFSS